MINKYTDIRSVRKAAGLTQMQLANAVGVTQRTIARYDQSPAPTWLLLAVRAAAADVLSPGGLDLLIDTYGN